MLKLAKMEICGFKSFCDRTQILFQDGITAVVGPNGCGKSNIADAINWVLGEQSPRSLRGKLMADVIFAGTEARKATGMAEVSMVLSGANGDAGSEVVVTRRLFRSGESEYLLNGARARLKDIQELLRERHVGTRAYATIEQGRIDQIINAKPKDTRVIVEEAAGVAGYKHKRRLTELKLEATEANLLRVGDIIAEVRRQINSLKRQASRARRYQRLRERMREKQRIRFGLRGRQLEARLDRVRGEESRAKTAEAELAAKIATIEAELAQERTALDEASREYREAADRVHRLDMEVDRGETRIAACREKIEEADQAARRLDVERESLAERRGRLREQVRAHEQTVAAGGRVLAESVERMAARQDDLQAADACVREARDAIESLRREQFEAMNQAAEIRNRRRSLEQSLERNRSLLERLDSERTSTRDDVTRLESEVGRLGRESQDHEQLVGRLEVELRGLEQRLVELRAEHARRLEELAAAREQGESATARLRTLEDVTTRFAGVSDGVRALLSKGASVGIRTGGVIADFVEAGPEIEGAVEVYLQGLLPAVILEDDSDAQRAAELLRAEGAGRTTFICKTQPAGALAVGSPGNGAGPGVFPAALLDDRRVRGRLRERLSLNVAANGVLGDRIGDAVLVDNLESALELHRMYPGVDFIAETGEVVYASGIATAGGRHAADTGMLAHKRRILEARGRVSEIAVRAAGLQREVEASRATLDGVESELRETREALEASRRRRVELELRARQSAEDRQRNARRSEVLEAERLSLAEEAATIRTELEGCAALVTRAEQQQGELEQRLAAQAEALAVREREHRELAEQAATLRAEVAAERQRQEAAEREGAGLCETLEEIERRVESAGADAQAARRRSAETRELLEQTEAELLRQLDERERTGSAAAERERRIAERRRALDERQKGLGSVRSELEQRRETAREAEVERTRLEADRAHLDELCHEELGLDATEAAAAAGEQTLDAADLGEVEAEIAELREKIERVGPVNIMAIDEFSELEERHEFLSTQQEDLQKSMASLKETIRKINRSSRERFLSAFEAIRRNYQETFRVLFNGGRADLVLEEDQDVLECGVEIMAQPPGKRLSSVRLLSGGERAMSAIALLFAIFRYQPSPFCLLDEVDAPLDDHNVARFTRLLQQYAQQTQFILITHNKLSMEASDLMYGVTMQEPGVSRIVSMQLS